MSTAAGEPEPQLWSEQDFQAQWTSTPTQIADLRSFHVLLGEWSQRMNLVGPSAMADFWRRHAYDSAQLLHVEQSATRWADVGAGAGFPGLVLAILMKDRKGAHVDLIESMAKRVRFLEQVVDTLALPAKVHHVRAEVLPAPPGLQVVTARACAPFPRLFDYTSHLFRGGVIGLFLKGRGVETELTEARRDWTFEGDLIVSRSDPAGRIARIRRLRHRG